MRFCDGDDAGYIGQTKRWVCGRLYPYELDDAEYSPPDSSDDKVCSSALRLGFPDLEYSNP